MQGSHHSLTDGFLGASVSRSKSPRAGDSLTEYELLEEIGRGGMGVVYKARQKSLDRIVAVKFIACTGEDDNSIQRFRMEARAAGKLQHPNVVQVHEVGIEGGQHFLVIEFIDGPNLATLSGGQPISDERAARYVKSIAGAIQYAHENRILHRDLKPSNVLVDLATDVPRVADFGLAREIGKDSSLTASGQLIGSPHFMPPEQVSSRDGSVGPASDVFGLGGILYYLLTGRAPFQGETLEMVCDQVLNVEPPLPRVLNPHVARDLETVCLKCLEKDPRRRYQTAKEVADELDRYLQRRPILARPVGAVGRMVRWAQRRPALATLVLLLQASLVLGLAGTIWQWQRAEKALQLSEEKTKAEAQARKEEANARLRVEELYRDASAALEQAAAMPKPETRFYNLRILQQNEERTVTDFAVDYHNEVATGRSTHLVASVTKQGQRGSSRFFASNPVQLTSGRGITTFRVSYIQEEAQVPGAFGTDRLHLYVLSESGREILSSVPFIREITWGPRNSTDSTAAGLPPLRGLRSDRQTIVTAIEILSRSSDLNEVTVGVEFELRDSLQRPQFGIEAISAARPEVKHYFTHPTFLPGATRRSFAVMTLAFQPPEAVTGLPQAMTEKLMVYLQDAATGMRYDLAEQSIPIQWRMRHGTKPSKLGERDEIEVTEVKVKNASSALVNVRYKVLNGEARVNVAMQDLNNALTASYLTYDKITVNAGQGQCEVGVRVEASSRSPKDIFHSNVVDVNLVDTNGVILARFSRQAPIVWVRPKENDVSTESDMTRRQKR
ncbi:MAG TPA: serine/threonine-protein kinase [Verrucomicrobiae bacterium]